MLHSVLSPPSAGHNAIQILLQTLFKQENCTSLAEEYFFLFRVLLYQRVVITEYL